MSSTRRVTGQAGASATDTPPVVQPETAVARALELMLHEGPVAFALIDGDNRIVYVNAAYERLLGYPLAYLRGRHFVDITHPDDAHVGLREAATMRRGGLESMVVHKRYRRANGATLWGRVVAMPLRDPAGRFEYSVSVVHDITAEREAQRRAEDWQRRYETVILASRRVLYDTDLRAGTTVWAGDCEATLGYRAEQLGGLQDWLARIHPADVERARQEAERSLATTGSSRINYRFRHGDGRWIWVRDSGHVGRDEHGRPERLIGFISDAGVEMELERERQRQDELFRIAAGVFRAYFWEWDRESGSVWQSGGMEQMLGWSAEELSREADGWRKRVHPDDVARLDFSDQRVVRDAEYRVRHRDGHWVIVWDRSVLVRSSNGRADRLIGATVDITERRLAAEEIRRLNAELEQRVAARTVELTRANQELEAFTYSVSHDLRAPLRHVAGFAELLRQRTIAQLDSESRRYLDLVLASSTRMGELLDRLLELSRLGRTPLAPSVIDPVLVVHEVIEELAPRGPIGWQIRTIPTVRADSELFRLVISNLLSNAIKYSAARSAPSIRVAGRALADGLVEIEIADNGVGFDMAHYPRLFGVFERLHPAGEYEGWGVGLASVQRIVTRHGGSVRASSAPDEGAIFTFTMPAAETRS